jgi:hypothetical protein
MKKTIYEISKESLEIISLLEENELTKELEEKLLINQNEIQTKSVQYSYIIKTFDYELDAIDQEIKRLQAMKKAKENAIDRMKESVLNAMNIYGIEKVATPTLSISIRKSESINIVNEDQVSDAFKKEKVTISIDKVAIKNAIKAGQFVAGATLESNQNLQIK